MGGQRGIPVPRPSFYQSPSPPVAMDPNANLDNHSNPSYRIDPSMLRMLNRLPKEMVERFSEQELLALYRAMPRSGKHAIDLRFTLPFLPRRLYFVFLMGQDKRSGQTRPEQQKPWTPATTAFAMVLTMATLITVYSVTYRFMQSQSQTDTPAEAATSHPTALPWIEKKSDCKGQTRQWKDGLCFEDNHDPTF